MTVLKIKNQSEESQIYLNGSLSLLDEVIKKRKTVIITDSNVFSHYGNLFPKVLQVVVIPPGEKSKTFESAGDLLRKLVSFELDRESLLVGIGGGVVTDLAGFLASTLYRGISFGFVATTVLAQVDAAIGGKNGVNLDGYKNMVGIIRQPEFVINDSKTLLTLPQEEFINGFSEVIKSALIADEQLFETLCSLSHIPYQQWGDKLSFSIGQAAKVKVDVVNIDMFEKAQRKFLNYGHTFGHAVEKITGMPHGYAVAIGMVVAAKISASRKMISIDDADKITKTIASYKLPTHVDIDLDMAMDAIKKDKKRAQDYIYYVLLNKIGSATVEKIHIDEIKEVLNDLY